MYRCNGRGVAWTHPLLGLRGGKQVESTKTLVLLSIAAYHSSQRNPTDAENGGTAGADLRGRDELDLPSPLAQGGGLLRRIARVHRSRAPGGRGLFCRPLPVPSPPLLLPWFRGIAVWLTRKKNRILQEIAVNFSKLRGFSCAGGKITGVEGGYRKPGCLRPDFSAKMEAI